MDVVLSSDGADRGHAGGHEALNNGIVLRVALALKVIGGAAGSGGALGPAVRGTGGRGGGSVARAVSGDGGDGGVGPAGAYGGGPGGDAEAFAGRGVGGIVAARGGVGRDCRLRGGNLALLDLNGALLGSGTLGLPGNDGDDALPARRYYQALPWGWDMADLDLPGDTGDLDLLELRAVGAAAREGQEASLGAGDLAVAVVTGAGTLLDDRAQSQGGEGENSSGLHCEEEDGYPGGIKDRA